MLKELQKQIEQKKRELTQPTIEMFEQIFKGFEITIDFDLEGAFSAASMQQKTENSLIILNFTHTEEEKVFTNYALKYEVEQGIIVGVKASPFSIDQNVINYVFYELENLLKGLQKEETTENESEAPKEE